MWPVVLRQCREFASPVVLLGVRGGLLLVQLCVVCCVRQVLLDRGQEGWHVSGLLWTHCCPLAARLRRCSLCILQVSPAAGGSEAGPIKVVTTPQRMLAVVQWRLQQLQQQPQQQQEGTLLEQQQQQLPSGEALQQALLELQEDITEYDVHVYSKMTKRDMYGRF
jgi:predicted membrane metal-binding protein